MASGFRDFVVQKHFIDPASAVRGEAIKNGVPVHPKTKTYRVCLYLDRAPPSPESSPEPEANTVGGATKPDLTGKVVTPHPKAEISAGSSDSTKIQSANHGDQTTKPHSGLSADKSRASAPGLTGPAELDQAGYERYKAYRQSQIDAHPGLSPMVGEFVDMVAEVRYTNFKRMRAADPEAPVNFKASVNDDQSVPSVVSKQVEDTTVNNDDK